MAMEKFHHTVDIDGEEHTIDLPKFSNIPFGVIRKMRKETEAEQMFMLVETIADENTLALIDQLGMGQMEDLFVAWQKDSGITVGESSASSTS